MEKTKKPIWKKWWVWVIVVLIIAIASQGGETDKDPKKESEKTTSKKETKQEVTKQEKVKAPVFGVGTYLVGKDIQAGLYKVKLKDSIMKMGYVERSSDVSMELSGILANIILTGDGYVEVLPTDVAVRLQGVEISPIALAELKPNIKNEASDGIYLIGYDLAPGTYKVEVTDTTTKMGYVERSKKVSMGIDDILANQIIQGPGYVEIKDGDFAVRLQGVKITKQ